MAIKKRAQITKGLDFENSRPSRIRENNKLIDDFRSLFEKTNSKMMEYGGGVVFANMFILHMQNWSEMLFKMYVMPSRPEICVFVPLYNKGVYSGIPLSFLD